MRLATRGPASAWLLLLCLWIAGAGPARAATELPAPLFPLAPGDFVLGNHPDGNQAPPHYGLRLDGLDGTAEHVFTFDFGHCSDTASALGCTTSAGLPAGVGVTASFDGSVFSIDGVVYGGRAQDDAFTAPIRWSVHFEYGDLVFDPALGVMAASEGSGSGLLTALDSGGGFAAGEQFDLLDKAGENPFSFGLVFDHRGLEGRVSGIGWLRVDGDGGNFKDWLFTLEVVPEPNTFLMAGLGLAGLAWGRRAGRARGPGARR